MSRNPTLRSLLLHHLPSTRAATPARRFVSVAGPSRGQPLATLSAPRLTGARAFSNTSPADDHVEPKHAAIAENIINEWPKESEYDPNDLGHNTDGSAIVGRHNKRTLSSFSMENKVCVVTGAARGLGNLFARTFVESGANQIVILDLDQKQAEVAAEELVAWFEENGQVAKGEVSALGLGCDVSKEEQVQACFKAVVEKYGRVDVLVTAAGIVENFPATEYPADKFRKCFAINVDGSFFCAREAAKDMIRRGKPGSIVMIGSMSGAAVNIPQPQSPYNASKAAVRHMASSLAVEWATKDIRVNVISPGYMKTALTKVILEREPVLNETWTNLTPMGRLGEPEDLKGAVIYLASDASKFTTGADLRVDGGYTLT